MYWKYPPDESIGEQMTAFFHGLFFKTILLIKYEKSIGEDVKKI